MKARNASQPDEEISLNAQMVADRFVYHYTKYNGGHLNRSLLTGIEAATAGTKSWTEKV